MLEKERSQKVPESQEVIRVPEGEVLLQKLDVWGGPRGNGLLVSSQGVGDGGDGGKYGVVEVGRKRVGSESRSKVFTVVPGVSP